MPLTDAVRGKMAYLFILVGLVWGATVAVTGSVLLAWPTVACLGSGALLLAMPQQRITFAWVTASAVLGLLLSAWQVFVAIPFVSGAFAAVAAVSLAAFLVFGAFHALLLYTNALPASKAE